MTRVSDVWDSATDVLAGRAGVLAPIAAVAFVLPAAVQSAIDAYGDATTAATVAGGLVALLATIVSLWGQLAVIAVATDPATTRGEAGRVALARLPAGLLVLLILVGLVVVLMLPAIAILAAGGVDLAAAATGPQRDALPVPTPGAAVALVLYALVALALLVWAGARLFLVNPVVTNERRAAGAIGRSIALTRGWTMRLIGVALLFGIAWAVAVTAAQAVVGLTMRLLLGGGLVSTATFLAAIAGACVTAAWIVVIQVFAARLYAAIVGGGAVAPRL